MALISPFVPSVHTSTDIFVTAQGTILGVQYKGVRIIKLFKMDKFCWITQNMATVNDYKSLVCATPVVTRLQ